MPWTLTSKAGLEQLAGALQQILRQGQQLLVPWLEAVGRLPLGTRSRPISRTISLTFFSKCSC